MTLLNCTVCLMLGYFVGGINPAYLISRTRGFDIRKKGSGNAGASNAVILMGKKVGAMVAFFDILKAYVIVTVAALLFPTFQQAKILTGIACILGHVFPVFMRFRGGKGLASLGGFILAYDWRVFVALVFSELILVLIVDYICFVPITVSAVFPVIYAVREDDMIGAFLFLSVTAVILYKHMANLHRIRKGTEIHFSYLWRKDKELERIRARAGGSDEEFHDTFHT